MDELEVARFASLPEAEAVAALLRTHGIAARLPDSQTLGAAAHLQFALGGVRLVVPDYQIVQARELVARARAGEFSSMDAVGEDAEDEAPARGSLMSLKRIGAWIVILILGSPVAACLAISVF